jgi:hypothetical protein
MHATFLPVRDLSNHSSSSIRGSSRSTIAVSHRGANTRSSAVRRLRRHMVREQKRHGIDSTQVPLSISYSKEVFCGDEACGQFRHPGYIESRICQQKIYSKRKHMCSISWIKKIIANYSTIQTGVPTEPTQNDKLRSQNRVRHRVSVSLQPYLDQYY